LFENIRRGLHDVQVTVTAHYNSNKRIHVESLKDKERLKKGSRKDAKAQIALYFGL
jgi:hypothetical protein